MNDQNSIENRQSEPLDRHEAREQRREARREALGESGNLTWVAGIILILLGVAFLLQNQGIDFIPFDNWWALFILIPAVSAFATAWRLYLSNGNRLVSAARSSLLAGVILSLVTISFLFNLDWQYFGPVLIILAGIGIIATYTLPGKE